MPKGEEIDNNSLQGKKKDQKVFSLILSRPADEEEKKKAEDEITLIKKRQHNRMPWGGEGKHQPARSTRYDVGKKNKKTEDFVSGRVDGSARIICHPRERRPVNHLSL